MPVEMTRRELFTRANKYTINVLPPWAGKAADFQQKCDGCGDCVVACPENILVLNDSSLAKADFSNGICNFCGECATSCPTGALIQTKREGWDHKASFKASCLSAEGVVCRLCEEACEAGAIKFKLMLQGRSMPLVDHNNCNGCGGCVHVCPVDAVILLSVNNEERNP